MCKRDDCEGEKPEILACKVGDIADGVGAHMAACNVPQMSCYARDTDHNDHPDKAAVHHDFKGIELKTHGAPCNGHCCEGGDGPDHPKRSAQGLGSIAHLDLFPLPFAHTTRASVSKVRSASCQVGMLLASYPQTLPCAIWAKTFMVFR